jgi:hypothetical protein
MNESLSTEIAALEQALHNVERADEALAARDELNRRRLGGYASRPFARGDLALRIKNELERLYQHRTTHGGQ